MLHPGIRAKRKTFDIYFIDTEGGHSTLYVTPSGESRLIDAGNPGTRDADRIMAPVEDAGLKQLDYLVLTHYHVDHIGGVKKIVSRVPIKHFVDHGPTVEEPEQIAGFQDMDKDLWSKADHLVGKPGAKLPISGIEAASRSSGICLGELSGTR